ncbi:MAG: class B sortase [Oscillospiraceae bacterium]|nr:class B sortase [Oscillospiraceae bacterium]
MKKAIVTILILILLAIFGISAFHVVTYFVESKEQEAHYDELSDIVKEAQDAAKATTAAPEGETKPVQATQPENTQPEEGGMLPGYAELYEINNDLVGWIRIEGTEIDYPVMQTPGRTDFYLKRNFNKDDSERGCLYVREECDVFRPSDNVTIYGHTMMDGSMFAYLHEYQDKEVWEDNKLIFFDTLYEYHVYKIFSVFITTANLGEGFTYHRMEDAESEEDFDKFIATCKDLSLYDTGITPEYGDKIICLSTCEYTQDNGRLVVAAVRIS